MAKHRIVTFTDGVARVQITDDFTPWLEKEDNKTVFINPDMRYAKGFPPELWEVRDGKIYGMDSEKAEERIHTLHLQAESRQPEIQDAVKKLFQTFDRKLDVVKESLEEEVALRINDDNYLLNKTQIDLMTQINLLDKKWSSRFVALIVVLVIIEGIRLFV